MLRKLTRPVLKKIVFEKKVKDAIAEGGVSRKYCSAKFLQTIEKRQELLKSAEINRILQGILQIAYANGEIDDLECQAFQELAAKLGISEYAADLVRERFLEECREAER